jgi:predicted small metal-binding protein
LVRFLVCFFPAANPVLHLSINHHQKEIAMARKYIDCREFPGDIKCSIAISADSDKELLEAAVQHAVAVHGYKNTAGLRREIKSCFKKGTPPVAAPRRAKS